MKTTPFFLSTAISLVSQGLLVLVSTAFSYFAISSTFNQLFGAESAISNFFVYGISSLSCLNCLVFPAIYLSTGLLYTILHWREASVSLEIGALGGGLSSASAGLITGIFSGLISIVLTPFIYQHSLPGQLPSRMNFPMQTINILTTSFSNTASACWSTLVAGGLGTLGGLLGGAIFINRIRG